MRLLVPLLIAAPASAQVPEVTVTKTADKLLDYGILGLLCLILLGAAFFLAKHLIECHKAQATAAGTNATAIANHASAMDKVADSLQDVARRLETIERALERRP